MDKCRALYEIHRCFVEYYLDEKVLEPINWIEESSLVIDRVKKTSNLAKITFKREFTSFIKNPQNHLVKKLFIYTHGYRNGRLSREDYAAKAMMVINTSLRTNMR